MGLRGRNQGDAQIDDSQSVMHASVLQWPYFEKLKGGLRYPINCQKEPLGEAQVSQIGSKREAPNRAGHSFAGWDAPKGAAWDVHRTSSNI